MAARLRVHGIVNCDSVRAARRWLRERGIEHDWIDVRASPPSAAVLGKWSRAVGHEQLLNRRGSTWRGLDAAIRERVCDEASAIAAMHERPTLIRRPVIETGNDVVVGFDADEYARRFA